MRVRGHRTGLLAVALAGGAAVLAATAAVPASAAGFNTGAGEATVFVNFPGPTYIPPLGAPCGPVSFNLAGSGTGTVLNSVLSDFVGVFPLNGTGGDQCANTEDDLGATTFTFNGFDAVYNITQYAYSEFNCPTGLTGSFFRVGLHTHVDITGSCIISNTVAGTTHFLSEGEFIPGVPKEVPVPANPVIPVGGGSGSAGDPVNSGVYYGAFAMVPQQ